MPRNVPPGGGRLVALLLVAALVALAGCGGTSPSTPAATDAPDDVPTDETDAPDGAGDDTRTTSPSPTPTPTATPTPTSTATPTPTPTATEASDAGRFAAYGRNLRNASSYTVDYTIETSGNRSGRLTGTVRANLDRETLYQTLEIGSDGADGGFEYYRPPGADVFYTRLESGGSVAYREQNVNESQASVFSDPVTAVRSDSSVADLPDFRDAGTVRTDDGPRRKFVVDDPAQLSAATRERYAEIRSVSWVVLVDEDRGYVTDVEYELTFVRREGGDARTVVFDLSYRDIGSTTVGEPDWLDEARERTD